MSCVLDWASLEPLGSAGAGGSGGQGGGAAGSGGMGAGVGAEGGTGGDTGGEGGMGPLPRVAWARFLGGASLDAASGLAHDAQGRLWVAGRFTDSADLAGHAVVSAGGEDGFVMVFDADGTPGAVTTFGGLGVDRPVGLARAASGRMAVVGQFEGTASAGGLTYTSQGGSDVFVLVLTPDGVPDCVVTLGGLGDVMAGEVEAAQGSFYVVGRFQGTLTLGGTDYTAQGLDGFSAVIDETCTYERGAVLPSTGDVYVWDVAAAADGRSWLGLDSSAGVDFGSGPVAHAGGDDAYVARFDPDGGFVGVTTLSAPMAQVAPRLGLTPNGEIWAYGGFQGSVPLGSAALTSAGGFDIYGLRLDATGAVLFSEALGGAGREVADEVAAGPSGEVAVGGVFDGPADFGDGLRTPVGGGDVFAFVREADGSPRWSFVIGSALDDDPGAIHVMPDGHVALAGVVGGATTIGDVDHPGFGDYDIFVTMLRP
ncbi:MAG: hypothetical protein KC731_11555 [Myxococcales bacterium]|nr:hypothetical protein [Myxococcales bacterium]